MPQRRNINEEKLQSIREKLKEWPTSCDEGGDYINILLVGHGNVIMDGRVKPISDRIAGNGPKTFGIPSTAIVDTCGMIRPVKYYHSAKHIYKMKC